VEAISILRLMLPGGGPAYPSLVPTDDEFRRVAEDVRALARSLTRDVLASFDQARQEGRKSSRAISEEMREAARQTRQQFRTASRESYRSHRGHWGGHYGPPPPPGAPGDAPTAVVPRPPPPPRPARHSSPPLRHRRDSSTVLGIVALVLGLSWLAAGTHLFAVPWRAAVAVALMVLGGAMVVTARTDWALSRRFWPVLLGGGLVVVLVLGSTSFAWPDIGSRRYSWPTWAAMPRSISGGLGATTIDLRQLSGPPPLAQTLEVGANVGTLHILLPANLHVLVDDRSGIGGLTYNKQREIGGIAHNDHADLDPKAPGAALTLDIRSAIGTIRIDQAQPTA
jgi:hypothetical protein